MEEKLKLLSNSNNEVLISNDNTDNQECENKKQNEDKEEIKEIILSLEDRAVPNVMKHFKLNYNGKCDMKEVNEVLRSLS